MRALRPLAAALTLVAAALGTRALACTPFGAGASPTNGDDAASGLPGPDGSPDDAASGSEPDGGADAGSDPDPLGTCLDFTTDTHGVTSEGATRGAEGFTLEIAPGKASSIRKTFTANVATITKSVVTVFASATATGTWATASYVDVMAQYLGDRTDFTAVPAMELELLQARLELNVWNAPNHSDGTYKIDLASLPPATSTFRIETTWPKGITNVDIGAAHFPITTAPTPTVSTNRFTVVVGGRTYDGTTPKVVFTVKKLCVDLR